MNFKKFISGIASLAVAVSVFAGLAVTASAESSTAFSQDFTANTDGSTDPADYGFALSYGNGSSAEKTAYSVTDGLLQCASITSSSEGTRTGLALATFNAVGAGNEVSVSYVWNLGNATGNASGSWTETYIADASGNKILTMKFFGSDSGKLTVNDTEVAKSTSIRGTTYTVSAKLNMNTCKITSLVMTCSNSSYSYTASEALDFYSESAAAAAQFGFQNSARQTWTNTASVDDILITYDEAKAEVESITVNYKTADNTLIKSDTLQASDLYTASYDTEKSAYSAATTKATTAYIGDVVYIPFSKYAVSDTGVLYKSSANSSNPYYGDLTTLKSETVITKTVEAVTLEEGTTFIAFAEGSGDASNNALIRCSGMSGTRGSISAGNVQSGVYEIETVSYARGNQTKAYLDGAEIGSISVNSNGFGTTTTTVNAPVAGELTVGPTSSGSDYIDYILVTRTGDYIAPAAIGDVTQVQDTFTVGDSKYAKTYKFTVTPGTNPITSVSVTANNTTQIKNVSISEGPAVFGILITSANESTLSGIGTPTVAVN